MRPPLEVADIFRQHGDDFRLTYTLSPEQRRVMRAIERCRTAAFGGHVEQCDACGHQRIAYNSCRNRHCPKCQSLAKARWLQARLDDLLPVEYFHVVFTLPEQLASVALQNKRVVYNLLFSAASETLRTIAADPRHLGADIGFLAVLHTWDQTLRHHPHLHCVVPGGGLSVNGAGWRSCRPGFFLPVNVLARLFRRLFLQGLESAYDKGKLSFHGVCAFLAQPTAFKRLLKSVRAREWWVYAKPPFGGPAQVLAYLGRYTHRVAISNHRLLSLKHGKVTFSWRDNRHGQLRSTMTLNAEEFMRRFLLHVLPRGFQRIRQFGLLANRRRDELARCRQLLSTTEQTIESLAQDYKSLYQSVTGASLQQCPACRTGTMKFFSPLAALTKIVRPTISLWLRLRLGPSIHREEEVRRTCHPSPVCVYSSLSCGQAELCVLRCISVVGTPIFVLTRTIETALFFIGTPVEHESFSTVIAPHNPVDSIAIVPPRGFVQRNSF